ncbi:MAG: WXG100 family type VII secretion target [Pseudonocardia sediminis]
MADTKTYNYQVLNDCINQMKTKGTEIEQRAADLAKQTESLMGDWQGSTATQYKGMSADLKKELDTANQNLELTRTALQTGLNNMSDTDLAGTKSFM